MADLKIVAEPEVREYVLEHGGNVYVWANDAGLKHVALEPPDEPIEFETHRGRRDHAAPGRVDHGAVDRVEARDPALPAQARGRALGRVGAGRQLPAARDLLRGSGALLHQATAADRLRHLLRLLAVPAAVLELDPGILRLAGALPSSPCGPCGPATGRGRPRRRCPGRRALSAPASRDAAASPHVAAAVELESHDVLRSMGQRIICDEPGLPARPESRVAVAPRDQLVVRGDLDEPAVLHQGDAVGALGGREPVGDRDHRAALREHRERLLDRRLGLRVERRGRLVEDDHCTDRRARRGRARRAAARRSRAGRRGSARRSRARRAAPRTARARRCRRSASRVSSSVASGRPSRMFSAIVPEKRWPSCGTKTMRRRSSSRRASRRSTPPNVTRPSFGVVRAHEQLRERRLAGAGRADEREVLARRDRERHARDGGRVVAVGERDVLDDDAAGRPAATADPPCTVTGSSSSVAIFDERRAAGLELAEPVAEARDRVEQRDQIEREGDDRPDRHASVPLEVARRRRARRRARATARTRSPGRSRC